jgi:hypothetical protein
MISGLLLDCLAIKITFLNSKTQRKKRAKERGWVGLFGVGNFGLGELHGVRLVPTDVERGGYVDVDLLCGSAAAHVPPHAYALRVTAA